MFEVKSNGVLIMHRESLNQAVELAVKQFPSLLEAMVFLKSRVEAAWPWDPSKAQGKARIPGVDARFPVEGESSANGQWPKQLGIGTGGDYRCAMDYLQGLAGGGAPNFYELVDALRGKGTGADPKALAALEALDTPACRRLFWVHMFERCPHLLDEAGQYQPGVTIDERGTMRVVAGTHTDVVFDVLIDRVEKFLARLATIKANKQGDVVIASAADSAWVLWVEVVTLATSIMATRLKVTEADVIALGGTLNLPAPASTSRPSPLNDAVFDLIFLLPLSPGAAFPIKIEPFTVANVRAAAAEIDLYRERPRQPLVRSMSSPGGSDATGEQHDSGFFDAQTLAVMLRVDYDSLRKRLERSRSKDHDGFNWRENENRKRGQPRYEYRLRYARSLASRCRKSA